ncbi:MAG: RNA-binding protein [Rhodospirillales bacterium]|nr:RNA-binding protein [Rhodospirillales bacterium]
MKADPERKCIVTGEVGPAAELLRFVVGPDGQVVFDAAGKLPGRGLWLSARLDVLKTALKKGQFSKAAKARVIVPEDLEARVAEQLRARCLSRLGLARGAGQLIQGFEKVRAALKAGPSGKSAGVLLQASDAAPDGREKMMRLAAGLPVVALFLAEEIGHAIGRDNAVHAVLAPGKMAEAFLSDAAKLAGVMNKSLDGAADGKADTEAED